MIFVILAHYIIIILATKNMHHFPPHLILTVLCSLTRQSKMCFYVSVKLENTLCNEDCIIILKNSICTLLKVVERIYKQHFNQCSLQRLLKKLLTWYNFTQTAEVLPCVQSLGYQTAHKNVPSYALQCIIGQVSMRYVSTTHVTHGSSVVSTRVCCHCYPHEAQHSADFTLQYVSPSVCLSVTHRYCV